MVSRWVTIAFDSEIRDTRTYLSTEFDGLRLHVEPHADEHANLIAVFVEREEEVPSVRLRVNRFLSAMAWKDGRRYVTLGAISSGARPEDRDSPRFN